MLGFLDVLLRGLEQMALAAAAGGVAYALWGLRPLAPGSPLAAAAVARALRLIGGAAVVLAVSRALGLVVLRPWALADEAGWPVGEFLATEYAVAGLVGVGLALGLAGAARATRAAPGTAVRWATLAVLAAALLAGSAWLAHAVSRLEHRAPLMAATVLHQTGATLWVGGLAHLAAFWALARRAGPTDPLGPALVRRFSVLAMTGVGLVLGPGLYLSWQYIGDWGGLVGTGYGVMVLTKAALLGAVLTLGGLNYLLGRAWADAGATAHRVRALVEAEVGVGLTVLMAAAALTSLPPSVDVVQDRATPAEVAQRLTPRLPRLVSPAVGQLIAEAAPIDDTLATRQPVEYAWSEYNHHMAGLFVVTMGALALLERTGRARWARHWPLAMLGLAAFLFVRNDPRAWPLGPAGFWESLLLPDVLQHRVAVALVVALALFEWAVRTGRLRRPGFALVFPVLSAVGGAMLLTHSHAMFNLKAEFLTEVSHAPMGVLAVFTGWGRWLELRLPAGDGRLPGWIWSGARHRAHPPLLPGRADGRGAIAAGRRPGRRAGRSGRRRPAPPVDPRLPLPGRATPDGTAAYRARWLGRAADGHFRALGDLAVSSIGLGTYLGDEDDRTDTAYAEAVRRAVELGVNVVDCAINYRNQRSERAVGLALRALVASRRATREEIVVATKGGFLPFDGTTPVDPVRWVDETYVRSGLAQADEIVQGCHCLAPRYLADQLERSRANLGVATIDVYYLHNPEMQLEAVDRPTFRRRMRAAFETLEAAAADGRLGCYGAATWNGLRQPPEAPDHLDLTDLAKLAREVGGKDHHFRVLQIPYNLAMTEAYTAASQSLGGTACAAIEAARRLDMYVMTSASIYQGRLAQLPDGIAQLIPGLQTGVQRALQFARSTPGVGTALCGMSQARHVEENARLAQVSPMTPAQFGRLFRPA